MKNSARIQGTGLISPAGKGVDSFWKMISEEDSYVDSGLGKIHGYDDNVLRAYDMSLAAIDEAIEIAGWTDLNEVELLVATTTGYVNEWEELIVAKEKNADLIPTFIDKFYHHPLGRVSEDIKNEYGFKRGPLFSTACAAGTQALGYAKALVEGDPNKKVIVLGVECLSTLTVEGFGCFQLTENSRCLPFDKKRSGINLSEAAAAVCVSSDEAGKTALLGYSSFADAHNMTAPHPDGVGIMASIRGALKDADLSSDEIGIVHAHGTGSRHNDESEAKVFAEIMEKPNVVSTKGYHGHALAASGVLEAILIDQAIKKNHFPGNLPTPEPEYLDIINTPYDAFPVDGQKVLKTTLGFGGTNAALVFGGIN